MIRRETTQELTWLDLKERICSEKTVIYWYFMGILIKTRKLEVTQTMPEEHTNKGMGFSKQ